MFVKNLQFKPSRDSRWGVGDVNGSGWCLANAFLTCHGDWCLLESFSTLAVTLLGFQIPPSTFSVLSEKLLTSRENQKENVSRRHPGSSWIIEKTVSRRRVHYKFSIIHCTAAEISSRKSTTFSVDVSSHRNFRAAASTKREQLFRNGKKRKEKSFFGEAKNAESIKSHWLLRQLWKCFRRCFLLDSLR